MRFSEEKILLVSDLMLELLGNASFIVVLHKEVAHIFRT